MRSALRKILLLTVFCAGLAALWGQTVPGRRASCAMLEAQAWLHREYCQPGGSLAPSTISTPPSAMEPLDSLPAFEAGLRTLATRGRAREPG